MIMMIGYPSTKAFERNAASNLAAPPVRPSRAAPAADGRALLAAMRNPLACANSAVRMLGNNSWRFVVCSSPFPNEPPWAGLRRMSAAPRNRRGKGERHRLEKQGSA